MDYRYAKQYISQQVEWRITYIEVLTVKIEALDEIFQIILLNFQRRFTGVVKTSLLLQTVYFL